MSTVATAPKLERKAFVAVDAKWIAIVAPFATPDHAFVNPALPGVYVEPHGSGKGAILTATDGKALIRVHAFDAEVIGSLWLRTPRALIRACREPKAPKIHAPHVWNYQPPPLPDYLRPGKLIADVIQEDGKRHMEIVCVSPVKPFEKDDEGGFYAMTSNEHSQELHPVAKVSKGTGWMKKTFDMLSQPAEDTRGVVLDTDYLHLIARVGRMVDCPVKFTLHGDSGAVGFEFCGLEEGTISGAVMPILMREEMNDDE